MSSGSEPKLKRIWLGSLCAAIIVAFTADGIRTHYRYQRAPRAKLFRYYQSQITEDRTAGFPPIGRWKGQPLVLTRVLTPEQMQRDLGPPDRRDKGYPGELALTWANEEFVLEATVVHGRVHALDFQDLNARKHEHVGLTGERYFHEVIP